MRPTVIPSSPMDMKQAFDHIWNHFVTEKNPQSLDNRDDGDENLGCLYGGTGCGVGCCTTIETAERWDSTQDIGDDGGTSINAIKDRHSDEYKQYFVNNDDMLIFLDCVQSAHDSYCKDSRKMTFTEHMESKLKEIKEQFRIS